MTALKIATALTVLLTLAGAAAAEDTQTKAATPAYGPGWRHEQMVQAWQRGETPAAMMMRRGPGYGLGMGLGAARGSPALKADGTVDVTQLPPWCPMKASLQRQ
ncbi:MAG: hypothetical protein NVV74_15705 [Magnetospirillum sp.]|nr:hypothetical protein [Magnetospirillum sp.]